MNAYKKLGPFSKRINPDFWVCEGCEKTTKRWRGEWHWYGSVRQEEEQMMTQTRFACSAPCMPAARRRKESLNWIAA